MHYIIQQHDNLQGLKSLINHREETKQCQSRNGLGGAGAWHLAAVAAHVRVPSECDRQGFKIERQISAGRLYVCG